MGLDNIGIFDRSAPLPTGGHIEQSDGTAWVGMFCLNLLAIALELACKNPACEDLASKFFEHFVYIAHAINNIAGEGIELWNREKVRSMVGLIPLFAVETVEPEIESYLPTFWRRMMWFLKNRPRLADHGEDPPAALVPFSPSRGEDTESTFSYGQIKS